MVWWLIIHVKEAGLYIIRRNRYVKCIKCGGARGKNYINVYKNMNNYARIDAIILTFGSLCVILYLCAYMG